MPSLSSLLFRCVIHVLFLKPSVRYLVGMIKPLVYVETTIPSFYYEARTDAGIVARREWTQRWWNGAPERYELVTSPAVLDEWPSASWSVVRNDWLSFVTCRSFPSSWLLLRSTKAISGTS